MPNWKKIIVSGSDASLSSAYIEGNLTASAAYLTSASIGHLETIYETASVIYSSGSTKFGDTSDDTHEFTGSIQQSGSDSSFIGNVGIGNPSPRAKLDIFGEAADDTIVYMTQIDSSNDAPNFRAEKARGTDASKQDVVNDDGLFSLNTWAYYNGAYRNSGQFRFEVDGTPAGTNVPVVFALRTDDGSGLADRIRVNGDGTIDLLGSVTGSSITGSFTGSFEGTSSFAITASVADWAVTASHVVGGATNSGSFSGSFEGDGSGLTGISVTQAATITDTFTAQTSVTVSHNFVTENVLVTAYTDNGEQFIPQTVRTLDDNNVGIDFATSTTGRIVVAKGGHIVSGSVLTASLAMELSNLATASIADFATTASHTIGTASIANLATTASIADLASTLSNTATASFADTATTASHVVTASFADNATSASFAVTASYALNAAAGGGGGGIGATNEQTISVDLHVSESENLMLLEPFEISDGTTITVESDAFLYATDFAAPSLVDSASFAETASFVKTAQTASYIETAQTASHALQSQNNNSASGSLSFWQGSQAEYDLISASADPNTVYFVV